MPLDLGEIYDAHAQALFAFLLNLTRSEAETRDVLQEVFVKLARQPQAYTAAREPRAFLIRLARNLAIDRLRRRQTHEQAVDRITAETWELFARGDDPDESAFRESLTAALAELPLEQREVVHLKLWEELTFAEIAEVLRIPQNTAASRYRYGIDKLQGLLRPLYDELR